MNVSRETTMRQWFLQPRLIGSDNGLHSFNIPKPKGPLAGALVESNRIPLESRFAKLLVVSSIELLFVADVGDSERDNGALKTDTSSRSIVPSHICRSVDKRRERFTASHR